MPSVSEAARKAYAAQYEDLESDHDLPALIEALMLANERVAEREAMREYDALEDIA
ncbi:hypothetical protein [Tsukamurella tyrosinosolvens]|uniref:hypothetical protein n=1 Tax=Tsukamurella tyrosinosolvens TaxID=57704 RepID=UPI003F4A412C